MTSAARGGVSKQDKSPSSLSEQGHQQVMDYLRLAEKSQHPAIRDAAIDLAKQASKYQRNQGARVSPTLILCTDLTLGVAVVAACWFAFSRYPDRLAFEVSSIVILVFLVIVGTTLFLSGHLSQANFMKILGWLVSHVKQGSNLLAKAGGKHSHDAGDTDSDNIPPKK